MVAVVVAEQPQATVVVTHTPSSSSSSHQQPTPRKIERAGRTHRKIICNSFARRFTKAGAIDGAPPPTTAANGNTRTR